MNYIGMRPGVFWGVVGYPRLPWGILGCPGVIRPTQMMMEDSQLGMFATSGFAPLIRGFGPFPIFAFGGFATFCSISNNRAIMKQLYKIWRKIKDRI